MSNTAETFASFISQKMDTLSKNMKILFSVSHKQIPNQILRLSHGLLTLKTQRQTQ